MALATNAYPPLLRRLTHYVVPVYDYVLVTDPLTDAQWSQLGWTGREGVSDTGNQFHYYRTTEDGRILWGGYDAIYHSGNGFGPQYDHNRESYERLAEHFLQTFPQLRGIGFSHAWGGAIDTCSRFSAFWGTAHDGRVAYVAGYTGLGVGASRFGAATMLDLLDGRTTERTELEMVRTQAAAVPAGADPLLGHHPDHVGAAEGRRRRWPAEPVAEGSRPHGPRLRLLTFLPSARPRLASLVRDPITRAPSVRGGRHRTLHGAARVGTRQLVAETAHELAGQQVVGECIEHRLGRVGQGPDLVVVQRRHRPSEDTAAGRQHPEGGVLARGGQREQPRTTVGPRDPLDQSVPLQSLGQLDSPGVRDPQSSGQEGDRSIGVPQQRDERCRCRRPPPGRCLGPEGHAIGDGLGQRSEHVRGERTIGPRPAPRRTVRGIG